MEDFVIRKARREDCETIMKLIYELAVYEKMPEQVIITSDTLVKDAFDSDPPYFHCLVAEAAGKVVGYAMYFYAYSTDDGGEFLYLEDLLVTESCRGTGIGKRLLSEIVKLAEERNCSCVQWCVLNWNTKAIGFYQYAGAYDLTLKDDCHMYRLTKDKYETILSPNKTA